MGLILRTSSLANPGNDLVIKGSSLTPNELDGNFMYLLTNMSGSTISITGSTGIIGNFTATGDITFPNLTGATVTNVVGYNTSTGRLFFQSTSSLSAATASYITSSNVYGPNGADSVSNTLFASSSTSASYASTADSSQTAVSSTTSVSASLATQALTASYITLQAGPGITTNGIVITASVRSVNGNYPDSNGNIQTSLVSTIIGTSASLEASSSGAITGSLTDGLVWIIAGDPNPNNNGDTYIFSLGTTSGSWYPISTLDTTAGDARYLKLTPQSPLSGSLNMGGFNITNIGTLQGTASWANNAVTASYVTNLPGVSGSTNSIPKFTSATTLGTSSITDNGTTVTMTTNIRVQNSNNPSITYIGGTSASMYLDASYGGGTALSSIIRQSTGSQAKLIFGTGNTSSIDWSIGTTNNSGSGDLKIAYGDIITPSLVALTIASGSRYVGINRTNPGYNLHVSGTVSFTDLTTGSVANVVMINTTTGQLFYTSSAALASASIYTGPISTNGSTLYSTNPSAGNSAGTTDNIFLGYGAGDSATSAQYSVGLGYLAGFNATNVNSSVFIGSNAGSTATDANQSVFIGEGTGNGASSANNSVFLGASAGFNASIAEVSNFIGNSAGYEAVYAASSNFIGSSAGYQATYSSQSVFIGSGAGYQSPNASYSNFIGYNAGITAANAANSNFIGANAGNSATNATSSNFIGATAGASATNAYNSNFIGELAGYQAINARYSNFFGYQSGRGATNARSSSFIGNTAGYGAISASNSIFVGHAAGYSASFASSSIFFGINAGYNASTAANSILIGFNVGNNVVTASSLSSNNIVIGTNITLPSGSTNNANIGVVIFASGLYSTLTGNAFSGSSNTGVSVPMVFRIMSIFP